MARSVAEAAGYPLLPLALVGLIVGAPSGTKPRQALLIAIVFLGSFAGLMRLHATGGYCTPRHALIPSMLLVLAAARGLSWGVELIRIPGRWFNLCEERLGPGPVVYVLALAAMCAWLGPQIAKPINQGVGGYRDAGRWLVSRMSTNDRIVDVTGWSLYYARQSGYTFANLGQSASDQGVRYVVVREQHLHGPWEYCKILRSLTQGLEPAASFPEHPKSGVARVLVFDRKKNLPAEIAQSPRTSTTSQ